MPALTPFPAGDHPGFDPEHDHPRPDRRLAGNPLRSTWNLYDAQGVSAGIWACEPGAWHIAFADDKDEYFHVLAGRLRIADQDGNTKEFGPGDACIIPAGFRGIFEVLEAVRKHYVLIERSRVSTAAP